MTTRTEQIADVRALLDYLEARPNVPMPDLSVFDAFAAADNLRAIGKAMGGFDKRVVGGFFILFRRFGSVALEINFYRNEVCTARKVGTKTVEAVPAQPEREVDVYEWDCPPSVLAETP